MAITKRILNAARPPKALRPGRLPVFDVIIIDADSLIYQIAWTVSEAAMCIKIFDRTIADLMLRTDCYICHVLVKGEWNFRNFIDPNYKIKRRTADYTTPEVKERTLALYSYVQKNYGMCEDGGEADDWAAVLMKQYILEGKNPVICHIDKDLNMIPGWHFHIKIKDFYYQTPEQAFYFFMKQCLIGDMTSDSIPGLNKIGEVKASEKLRGVRLSQLRDRVIYLWKNHAYGHQQNDPDDKRNPREIRQRDRYLQMIRSVNLLYLRNSTEHFRELTEKEVRDIMLWTDLENDTIVDHEVELIRMGVYSLSPATYTVGQIPPGTFRKDKREKQVDIAKEVAENKRTKYTDDPQRNNMLATGVRYRTPVLTSRIKPLIKRVGDEDQVGKKRSTGGKVASNKREPLGGLVLARSPRSR